MNRDCRPGKRREQDARWAVRADRAISAEQIRCTPGKRGRRVSWIYEREHLGEAAAHASVAFGNWYDLVRGPRDSLGHLAVPISEKKTRLSQNFGRLAIRPGSLTGIVTSS